MTTPNVQVDNQQTDEQNEQEPEVIYCHRRNCPGSTGLRCYKTGVPICQRCAVRTEVGYISIDAQKAHEDKFFNIKPADYFIAASVAFFGTLLIGLPLMIFLGGFWFIMIFIAPAVGGAVGEAVGRAIGFRRGRYTVQVVGAAIILAVILLVLFTSNIFAAVLYGLFGTGAALARLQVAL